MKTSFFYILLFTFSFLPLRAQEVFQFELENSERAIRNPHAGFLAIRLASFQHVALVYLQEQSALTPTEQSPKWLDCQAYHLADFLALYHSLLTDEVLGIQEADRIKTLFRDATLAHPYFHDSDSQTLRFIDTPNNNTTPFSLDTDWEKAFHSIFDHSDSSPYRRQIEEFKRISKH